MLNEVLQKHWGYSSFRDKQEAIIRSILDGKDTFALLPTGGGKSICYQLPALLFDGVCIVVSPLVALMRDQVQQLKSKGISATYLYSGLSSNEISIELENIRNSRYKIVYVSPERLQSKAFKQNLKRTQVGFLAVDEAHCISQWGHDFRPEYRQIAEIKEQFPKLPILALTASATKNVVQDIIDQLKLESPAIYTKSFKRDNLSYRVIYEENKRNKIVELLQRTNGSGIIYVRTRRKTKEIADLLNKKKIIADYYHGGLPSQIRNTKQDKWINNEVRVVVCTNAFGMGIDKSDVRFVIHYDLPESIEAYYQEAGRAGRDGKRSICSLLYEESDVIQLRTMVSSQFHDIKHISRIYESFCNYLKLAVNSGLDARFDIDLADFSRKFELKPLDVYTALKQLEKLGYLHLSPSFYRPSKLKVSISSTLLYDFQLRYPGFDKLIKTVLRSYAGIYDYYATINEATLAQRLRWTVAEVKEKLNRLNDLGVVSYQKETEKPFVTFLQRRVTEIVDREGLLKQSKKRSIAKVNAVVKYLESESCRSNEICSYFGESTSDTCGVCDLCLLQKRLTLNKGDFSSIEDQIMDLIQSKKCRPIDVMKQKLSEDLDNVRDVLYWLVEDKKIILDKSGYLQPSN